MKQVVEHQIVWADAENWKKADDNFYKMDEESIVTIQEEELLDDFYALAETQIDVVQKLLVDGQLRHPEEEKNCPGRQNQFESSWKWIMASIRTC